MVVNNTAIIGDEFAGEISPWSRVHPLVQAFNAVSFVGRRLAFRILSSSD